MSESTQNKAKEAVEQLQNFDANSLIRQDELGRQLAFTDAAKAANRLITLFLQIPVTYLSELPDSQAQTVLNQAQAILNRFREIEQFDPTQIESPASQRDNLITQLENAYDATFNAVWQHVAYLSSRQRDFGAMEVEARSVVETVRKEASDLKDALESQNSDAARILADIKKIAAEQGVSQQAIHFKEESDNHFKESEKWQCRTIWAASILAGYGILTIFLHKIPFITPSNSYETIQLAVSKVLIFLVLGYLLTLSAKNYLAHRHNQIVNKHRQNALATYKAIAEAAHDDAGRDIVLSHAADCIFSPQETGLSGQSQKGSNDSAPTLQVLPRLASPSES